MDTNKTSSEAFESGFQSSGSFAQQKESAALATKLSSTPTAVKSVTALGAVGKASSLPSRELQHSFPSLEIERPSLIEEERPAVQIERSSVVREIRPEVSVSREAFIHQSVHEAVVQRQASFAQTLTPVQVERPATVVETVPGKQHRNESLTTETLPGREAIGVGVVKETMEQYHNKGSLVVTETLPEMVLQRPNGEKVYLPSVQIQRLTNVEEFCPAMEVERKAVVHTIVPPAQIQRIATIEEHAQAVAVERPSTIRQVLPEVLVHRPALVETVLPSYADESRGVAQEVLPAFSKELETRNVEVLPAASSRTEAMIKEVISPINVQMESASDSVVTATSRTISPEQLMNIPQHEIPAEPVAAVPPIAVEVRLASSQSSSAMTTESSFSSAEIVSSSASVPVSVPDQTMSTSFQAPSPMPAQQPIIEQTVLQQQAMPPPPVTLQPQMLIQPPAQAQSQMMQMQQQSGMTSTAGLAPLAPQELYTSNVNATQAQTPFFGASASGTAAPIAASPSPAFASSTQQITLQPSQPMQPQMQSASIATDQLAMQQQSMLGAGAAQPVMQQPLQPITSAQGGSVMQSDTERNTGFSALSAPGVAVGTLLVSVIRGDQLKNVSLVGGSTQDPFVVLELMPNKMQKQQGTTITNGGISPYFNNQQYRFSLDGKETSLLLKIKNSGVFSRIIGRCEIPIRTLIEGTFPNWVKLDDDAGFVEINSQFRGTFNDQPINTLGNSI